MPDTLASPLIIRHTRLAAYQELVLAMHRRRATSTGIWVDFLNRLPLTLGESEADRSVMVSVSDSVQRVLVEALAHPSLLGPPPAKRRPRLESLHPFEEARPVS